MDRIIVVVNQALDEGRDDEIAQTFQQANDAHANGKSSYSALSGAIRELRVGIGVSSPSSKQVD